jgi:tight adherence protein C
MLTDISSLGVIIAAGIILLGFLIFLISVRLVRGNPYNQRIQEFVNPQGTMVQLSPDVLAIPDDIKGSIISRTVFPFIRSIAAFLGKFASQASFATLSKKLSIAGNPMGMGALEFSGIRILLLLIGVVLALLYLQVTGWTNRVSILGAAGIVLIMIIMPELWLIGRVRVAKDEVRRGLPDALDMLSVCTEAGLGFDQSLQRVSEYWHTILGNELKRVVQEMELGVSRRDALQNMSNRLEVDELSSFVAVIIQSEALGMRIADVLHGQAEQMRVLRQFRAREIANRLPAKMIVPLALCIMPALLAVIFAPAIPALVNLFGIF